MPAASAPSLTTGSWNIDSKRWMSGRMLSVDTSIRFSAFSFNALTRLAKSRSSLAFSMITSVTLMADCGRPSILYLVTDAHSFS